MIITISLILKNLCQSVDKKNMTMMKKRHILHWAMGVILTPLLGSCTSDDVVGGAGREECDIILGQPITVTSATRATDGSTSSTPFDSGEIVWLWANKSDGSEYIKAWQLTAQSGGSLTGSSAKYWPSDGSHLNVYALHGNFKNSSSISEGTTQWSNLSLTHTVETDQTLDNNKCLSDLLYSQTSSAVAPNSGSVQLTFDHVLSKICITLKKADGSGIEDANLNNAKVEVSGINTEVTYDATNNRVTNSGTASTITLGQETSGSTTYEAIVPSGMTVAPQVKITLNDFPETGKKRTFSCTLSSVTFAKGNKYTFTLTLHNEIVVSSPSISEWIKDEATNMTIPQATG